MGLRFPWDDGGYSVYEAHDASGKPQRMIIPSQSFQERSYELCDSLQGRKPSDSITFSCKSKASRGASTSNSQEHPTPVAGRCSETWT